MARVAAFTSAGTPTGPRSTLAELMAKKKMLADQQGTIMAPRQIESWTQGAAQLAQAFVNARQQRGAEEESALGREQLAGAMAGIDWTKGPTPEQLQTIAALDPDAGQRIMEQSAQRALEELKYNRDVTRKDFEWSREQTDQEADEARQAAAAAKVTGETRAYEKTEEQLRDERELAQAEKVAADQRAEAERIRLANEAAAKAGKQVRRITGAEAEAEGLDPARTWEIPAEGGAAKDITIKPEAPASPSGKLEQDIAAGVYGDINDPKVAAYIDSLRKKEATATGATTSRADLWKQQDAFVNSAAAVGSLQEAKQLLEQGIDTGYLASLRTTGAKMGIPFVGDPEVAKRTDRYNAIMTKEAVGAMSQTLAGATTNEEMARFIQIMNDPTAHPDVKRAELDNMLLKATSFQELQRGRIAELGGEVPAMTPKLTPDQEQGLLDSAAAAIAKGAPADVVKKRLIEKGVSAGKVSGM